MHFVDRKNGLIEAVRNHNYTICQLEETIKELGEDKEIRKKNKINKMDVESQTFIHIKEDNKLEKEDT